MQIRKCIFFLIYLAAHGHVPLISAEAEMSNDWTQSFQVQKMILKDRSKYQNIVIVENRSLGKILMLDNIVEFTERDEFIYHEMIAHVPLNIHPNPKSVLIIGGGDGLILREALKHKSIESVSVIEIDAQIVDLCQQHFSHLIQGALEDPRVRLLVDEGLRYLQKAKSKYDVIIVNSTELSSPQTRFFENPIYQLCYSALNPSGIAVFQTGSPITQKEDVNLSYKGLKRTFKQVIPFFSPAPSQLGGMKSYALAFKGKLETPTTQDLEGRLEQIRGELLYYTPQTHQSAFIIPNYLKEIYLK